jgi:hypothetical protein
MEASQIYIQDHVDAVCDVVKKWADENGRISPALRDTLMQKIQKDLDGYFDDIDMNSSGSGNLSSVDIDFFDQISLAIDIMCIIQDELKLEDEECAESDEFEDKVIAALDAVTGEYSYDEIITVIARASVKCADAHFHLTEDQKKSLLQALEKRLKEDNADGSLELCGDDDDCSPSELSLDMDAFSEDELIELVRHDIDEVLAGDAASEGDRMDLRGKCRRAVQAMCKELYRMDSYENLA